MKCGICILFLKVWAVTLNHPLIVQQTSVALTETTTEIGGIVEHEYSKLFDLYRQLHSNPDLSFHETRTAERIAEELQKAGFEVTRNFAGVGVVGILRNGPGPTVMIRTDLDAQIIRGLGAIRYRSRCEDAVDKVRHG